MWGFAGYATTTLIVIGAYVVLMGAAVETAAGMLSAWAIQALAFRRLEAALDAGDATRAWLGGLVARAGGLLVVGMISLAGRASPDLPVAYGTTMLVLLLMEAGWLYRRSSRSRHGVSGGGAENGIEGTNTTG